MLQNAMFEDLDAPPAMFDDDGVDPPNPPQQAVQVGLRFSNAGRPEVTSLQSLADIHACIEAVVGV